jgi:hypothetical protein
VVDKNKQCFNLLVPAFNCSITAGDGATPGLVCTTDANEYHKCEGNISLEAVGDVTIQSEGGVLTAVAGSGVILGTPSILWGTAGGDVKLVAGAAMSPSLGDAGCPGSPGLPPEPPKITAGEKAESRNALTDGILAGGDVVGGIADLATGDGLMDKISGAFDVAKGGWGIAKATGAVNPEENGGWQQAVDVGLSAVDVAFEGAGWDVALDALADAVAPGEGGGGSGASAGAGQSAGAGASKIIEIAPTAIERSTNGPMLARVGGKKEALVDGPISYKSGAKIEMKAFSKVETTSILFEAQACAIAIMKGLAISKVESLGLAKLEGKIFFDISSGAKGSIESTAINIEAKAKCTVKAALLWIDAPTHVTEDAHFNKSVEIVKNLLVKSQLEVKEGIKSFDNVFAEKDVQVKGTLKAKSYAYLG